MDPTPAADTTPGPAAGTTPGPAAGTTPGPAAGTTTTEPPPGPASGADPARPDAGARLHRCQHHKIVGGVAAGLADYFGVDPLMVRIAFVVVALMGGVAIPLYLAGWLLIPAEDADLSVAEELLGRDHRR